MEMTDYTTLGKTGLRVSPLCLGTMTFGTEWGWGADEKVCHSMFSRFVQEGGNFIDTADGYTDGRSEEMVGKFTAAGNLRDRLVIATKFSYNNQAGNPNAGGNGRKNIYRALEGSLRRLKTDYVDLYYLHTWDIITPAEEVLSTLTDLVREGKIRYIGLSDVPAWYASRMQTIAEKEGKERIATLQLEYSLLERTIESEHIPAAQELGFGICNWGALCGGLLSGKYKRKGDTGTGDGRLTNATMVFNKFSDRNWGIVESFLEVAEEIGKPPAQVALNWVITQPGVTSTILGATSAEQLGDNLSAIKFEIPPELRQRLDEISRGRLTHPYNMFAPLIQGLLSGGVTAQGWRRTYCYKGAIADPDAT